MGMEIKKDLEWRSHDGQVLAIREISDDHLRNILRKIVRRIEQDDKAEAFYIWLNKEDDNG